MSNRSFKISLIIFLLSFSNVSVMAQENDTIIFNILDGISQQYEDSLENQKKLLQDLAGTIIDIENNKTEKIITPETSLAVLEYMTQAYSAHGFYETGYWGKEKRRDSQRNYRNVYPLYKGEVPESTVKDFYMPVIGAITSPYGYRRNRVHHGVDISLNTGDTVRAALPGVVVITGYEAGGYGNYVILAHSGGLETRYGHLSASLVSPGETIREGEAIALGGNTGNSTGPHLHFETRIQGVPIDPRSFFNF